MVNFVIFLYLSKAITVFEASTYAENQNTYTMMENGYRKLKTFGFGSSYNNNVHNIFFSGGAVLRGKFYVFGGNYDRYIIRVLEGCVFKTLSTKLPYKNVSYYLL